MLMKKDFENNFLYYFNKYFQKYVITKQAAPPPINLNKIKLINPLIQIKKLIIIEHCL